MQFYLFADDTSIYFDSDSLVYLQKIVKRELKKIKKWLEANRLAVNIGKTMSYFILLQGRLKNL